MSETKPTATYSASPDISGQLASSTVRELLEDVPLYSKRAIKRLFSPGEYGKISFPEEIRVHCAHEQCGGVRRHCREGSDGYVTTDHAYVFAVYKCTNCTETLKAFGLEAEGHKFPPNGICAKIYEDPPFGQPVPKRLFEVIGESNREHFLQARRAIARGLGIGAYAYYRRIVENTKFDLVSSVLKIAEATNASPQQIELLKKAQSQKLFSKAIEMLCDVSAIPAVLLIDGHNPLTLLHDALSQGIHHLTDAECLERAQESEVILCAIADQMQIALTERKEVKAAISGILKRKEVGGTNAVSP